MTLAEKLEKRTSDKLARTEELENTPLTDYEKNYWEEYIMATESCGTVNMKNDLYDPEKLFDGYTINHARVKPFAKWLESEGLSLHLQYNSCMTVYTPTALSVWANELSGTGKHLEVKDGIINCVRDVD